MERAVSIIIPCYNDKRFLRDSIESALNQTCTPLEVVVVDDGSTDGSGDFARRFGSRVTVQQKQNGGLSSARNCGIEIARGHYLTFLDADDILAANFLEETVPVLESDPTVSWTYVQRQTFGRESILSDFPEFDIPSLIRKNYLGATALFRAEVFQAVRFDERLRTGWEDWDLFLSLVERGHRGRLVDQPLLWYRKHPEADRMTDVMVDPRNKRRVHLQIMRRHLRLFGWKRYCHHLAHHLKKTALGL